MQRFLLLVSYAVAIQLACSAVLKVPIFEMPARHGSKQRLTKTSSQPTKNYGVNISIGTPPQTFAVQVMPTVSFAWVPDSSCKCPVLCSPSSIACWTGFCSINSECCDGNFDLHATNGLRENVLSGLHPEVQTNGAKLHPLMAGVGDGDCNSNRIRFQSSKSSTYKKDGTAFTDWSYGVSDEPVARPGGNGTFGVDTVSIGTLAIKNAQFGQAKSIDLSIGADGVLGIGPSSGNPKGVDSPIVTAFKQGLIEKPVATLWLGKTTEEDWRPSVAGELTYGGVDDAKCGPVSTYHPISTASTDNGLGWYVKASVTIGSVTVNPKQVQFDFSSGAGFMFADPAYEKQFLAGIGVTSGFWFDCKLTSTFNFKLTIDGHDYVVPGDEVVERNEKGDRCSLVYLGEGTEGQFVLGSRFLQKYCHSFDIANNAIGFGKNLVQN